MSQEHTSSEYSGQPIGPTLQDQQGGGIFSMLPMAFGFRVPIIQ